MIRNEIRLLSLDEITLNEGERRPIDEEHVAELAESIASTDLIHIPVVDESLTICAGGHRLKAWHKLRKEEVPCPNSLYEDWTLFPVRIAEDFSEEDLSRIELIENLQHRHLSWTETVDGITKLHTLYVRDDPSWSAIKTAEVLGITNSTVSRALILKSHIEDPIIQQCTSMGSAWNIVQRKSQRQKENELEQIITSPLIKRNLDLIVEGKTPVLVSEQPQEEEKAEEEEAPSPDPILAESFLEWVPNYSGPRFNFLHCDLPYGINLDKSAGQNSAKDSSTYEDSPEVYWTLLECLAENQARLLSSSCHILFWFSQNLRRETEDFFLERMPNFKVEKFLMVWHRTDNSGLLPDPQRYGRRNYETAFLLTSGDRKITKAKALCFGYGDKGDTKIHRSQKPLSVLTHFMSMFVDEHTKMLDPTCGSGTSIQAAYKLGASSILGLEIDPDMADLANKQFIRMQKGVSND